MNADDLTCPGCGAKAAPLIAPDELAELRPGDLTICPTCGLILVIDMAEKMREPAPEELEGLTPEDRELLQAASAATRRKRN